LFGKNVLMVMWGMYLAYRTRNVDENFNESANVGLAIYNCFISCAIIIPICFKIQTLLPISAYTLWAILQSYLACFTLVSQYYRRFWFIFTAKARRSRAIAGGGDESAMGDIGVDSIDELEETARRSRVQLEREIADLKYVIVFIII
jgi:hypothetical protein